MKSIVLAFRGSLILICGLLAKPGLAQDEFVLDFTSDSINERFMQYIGPHARDAIKQTNRGLIIKLPTGKKGRPQVGLRPKFAIPGDFEITVEYELVDVDPPKKGYGAGVMLRAFKDMEKGEEGVRRVNLARFNRPQGEVISTNYWKLEDGKLSPNAERFDAGASRGRLRLKRTGSFLHYLAAMGDSKEFLELRAIEFGTEPLKWVGILGDTGGSEEPITVRITKLTIRADDLPISPSASQGSSIWNIWFLVGAVGVLIVIGAGVQSWRQRRSMASD